MRSDDMLAWSCYVSCHCSLGLIDVTRWWMAPHSRRPAVGCATQCSHIEVSKNVQESLANARYARQPSVYEDLFLPSHRGLTPHSWGTPCDIKAIYTSLKSTFNGLQFRRWQYWFIGLAIITSETRVMSRNSKRIWPYNRSKPSKVIDLGVNGKPICDFLSVINCNFSRICYRFRDIHA